MNYCDTLVEVADDCPVSEAEVPQARGGKAKAVSSTSFSSRIRTRTPRKILPTGSEGGNGWKARRKPVGVPEDRRSPDADISTASGLTNPSSGEHERAREDSSWTAH